jgi:DNA repair protein RecO (recombination protein O)
MEWTDDGIVLSARKHGETSAVVSLLTVDHGRHAGLVRGGAGRRARGVLQPGNRVSAHWRARLPEHLGSLTCELVHGMAATMLDDGDRLAALSAACTIVDSSLPERQPNSETFERLSILLATLKEGGDWAAPYVRWERDLLADLGFGLDLSCCAATGRNDQLAYVSPRTGRAVSLSAGEPYQAKLLLLPGLLLDDDETGSVEDAVQGLAVTGHFLETNVYSHFNERLPAARRRLAGRLQDSLRNRNPLTD